MNQFEVIKSRDNSRLKQARAVRDGKERELMFIEGLRLATEALRSDLDVTHVFVSDETVRSERLAETEELLRARRISPIHVSSSLFGSISDTENSQGIVLLARRPMATIDELHLEETSAAPLVFLYEINNPSNLGAVVRTAEAAGAAAVLVSIGSADAFSPKALRASMGSSFRLPVVEKITFDAALRWASENGWNTVGADITGRTSYTDLDWRVPRMLVMGSEAHGLPADALEKVNEKILIPIDPKVESLNLAVSSGVILFEALRQRSSN